jgi:hypothetical protein
MGRKTARGLWHKAQPRGRAAGKLAIHGGYKLHPRHRRFHHGRAGPGVERGHLAQEWSSCHRHRQASIPDVRRSSGRAADLCNCPKLREGAGDHLVMGAKAARRADDDDYRTVPNTLKCASVSA